MVKRKQIIIIGAGHNGLVTANLLSEAEHQVTVLETREVVGGACVTEELFPGFKVSSTSYVSTLLLPQIVKRFELHRHGYRVIKQDPAFFVPYPDGRFLLLHGDDRDTDQIAKFSKKDAQNYPRFKSTLERIGNFLKPFLLKPPPQPQSNSLRDLWSLFQMGLGIRRLSPEDTQILVQLSTIGISDFLDNWFESDEIKAFFSSQAVIGDYGGPHHPGTAFTLLHDYLGGVEDTSTLAGAAGIWGVVVGGMGTITQALAAAAKERGATIRTNTKVKRIELNGKGKVDGVRLENGEVIHADIVASNATPRRTFLELLPQDALPEVFIQHIKGFKDLGASLKVHLALSELPDFTAMRGIEPGPQHRGLISFCPSVQFIEQAWEECKRGDFSTHPTVEACIHSVLDPSCAPRGTHIMSCFVQYGPRHLKRGNWEDLKETVAKRVIAEIAQYAPNLSQAVTDWHVYTPEDLEKKFGLTGGNIYHGAMTLDQLFLFRPMAGYADYRTPVKNLYLCGSGTHPGGGVWGAPGWNAAHQILRDIH
ncbi:MAG: NAD(P)/FAD-dependent oxidoreductase [Elusimicrobia bacterium]|nr:NAD(P)/FAD-dependent oxidoreductase [Elusimicrobiota bacterium]